MQKPAEMLLGKDLGNGWRVVDKLTPSSDQTGGNFSKGYIAEDSRGRRGFLKALDFSAALTTSDPARVLQAMSLAGSNVAVLRLSSRKRLNAYH